MKCKCGGEYHRTDIRAIPASVPGGFLYQDTDRFYAHFQCPGCARSWRKRKRQPKKGVK